ncbi:nucleolar protein 9-like, partial [Podargus strigoides]
MAGRVNFEVPGNTVNLLRALSRFRGLFAPNVLAEALPAVALDPGGSRLLQALLPLAPPGSLGEVLGGSRTPVLFVYLSLYSPRRGGAKGKGGRASTRGGGASPLLPASPGPIGRGLRGASAPPGVPRERQPLPAGGAGGAAPLPITCLRPPLQCPHWPPGPAQPRPCGEVGEVLSELGPALAEPLARGHPGVLTALLGACRRHPHLQPQALRCLFQAFGCWEPRERRRACVGLLAGLRPFGGGDKEVEGAEPEPLLGPFTLHGSLLLQHLLHFGEPGPVLGGLQALPPPSLVGLACSRPGSHVWDALLTSPTVPPRARRRLLRKLKGHLVSLACHRNGSR